MRAPPVIRQKKIYFTVLLLLIYILFNFYLLPSAKPKTPSVVLVSITPNIYVEDNPVGGESEIEYVDELENDENERGNEGLTNANDKNNKGDITEAHETEELLTRKDEVDGGEIEETPVTIKETVPSITFVQPVLPNIQLPSDTQHNPFTHTDDPVTAITTGVSIYNEQQQQQKEDIEANQQIESLESKSRQVLLFMAIVSSPDRFQSRQKLRDYWLQGKVGNATIQDDGKKRVDYAFYLGRVKSEQIQEELAQEQALYGDLVFLDFIDNYTNLTLKTRLIFKHAYDNYNWKYLAKIDDDIFLCYDGMTKFLNALPFSDNVYLGTLNWYAQPVRDKGHHWYISPAQWPEDTYPPYALGPFYLISSEIVKYLGDDSSVFPFEDTSVILSLRERGQPIHAIHIASLQIENNKNIDCAPTLWTHRTLDTMDHWNDCCGRLLWKQTEFSIHTFSWDEQKKFHNYRDESAQKKMQAWFQ